MTMRYKLGFIDAGHMGSALVEAAAKVVKAEQMIISDIDAGRAEILAKKLGCDVGDAGTVAASSQFTFIGVKPQNISELFVEISPILNRTEEKTVLVSMAAGVTLSRIRELSGDSVSAIRIMPNTPVAVSQGCVLYTPGTDVAEETVKDFLGYMSAAGRFIRMDESLIDAGCAISGCGPAFVYQFIMAMTSAGVDCGLPQDIAQMLSEQTVLGAAKLAIESGEAPFELCAQVCSPGGSTIEGVKSLRASDFSKAVGEAVRASYVRTVELGKS